MIYVRIDIPVHHLIKGRWINDTLEIVLDKIRTIFHLNIYYICGRKQIFIINEKSSCINTYNKFQRLMSEESLFCNLGGVT